MPRPITLPIVGSQYPNKRRRDATRLFALELCEPGDAVILRAEPENEVDENAIAVDTVSGLMMGYLPAERAPYVGMQIRRGIVSAIFQGRNARGGFVRIAFDGETPTLPPVSETDEKPGDWWPDPDYPDE